MKRNRSDDVFPMQPIVVDEDGHCRFKQNSIVRFLLDMGPFDMNKLAMLPGITWAERSQFAQLIGYSTSGFGDLSYADYEHVSAADGIEAEHMKKRDDSE